jgi:hypothetical protein
LTFAHQSQDYAQAFHKAFTGRVTERRRRLYRKGWYRLSTSPEDLLRRVELLETQERRLRKLRQHANPFTEMMFEMRATQRQEGEIHHLFQSLTVALKNDEEIDAISFENRLKAILDREDVDITWPTRRLIVVLRDYYPAAVQRLKQTGRYPEPDENLAQLVEELREKRASHE